MPNPTTAYDPESAPWAKLLSPVELTAALQDGWDVLDGELLPLAEAQALRAQPFLDYVTVAAAPDTTPTRFPTGSCLVRIDPDGSRRLLTFYDGPAYGWRNGRGFADPLADHAPTATYRGLRCAAALVPGDDESIELVVNADEPPEGFNWSRPGVCRAVVPISEVELA